MGFFIAVRDGVIRFLHKKNCENPKKINVRESQEYLIICSTMRVFNLVGTKLIFIKIILIFWWFRLNNSKLADDVPVQENEKKKQYQYLIFHVLFIKK